MDHSRVNSAFVDDLIASGNVGPQVIDLGCGPAMIPIELCKRDPTVLVMGIDAEVGMLEIAKLEVELAGMLDRVILRHADASAMDDFEEQMADTVISNSLIHHLEQPEAGLITCHRLLCDGGRLFVRDLARPDSEQQVERLVSMYAGEESPAAQQLFRQSLHAAITIDEVRVILGGLGISERHVQMTSDRHWTIDSIR
jgi:ubiquinone/menaquinone biosynthesis C-methylase UbiE